ncbi:type IV pilus biogenesis/stability protein PilW [Actimicrobium sp. CCC2.4]|uniref:type IV pilus biogenesis/stability protein PilW n=1 Tax=Actimicrobium sp. CCC2.4 TaxID=3048606 RepID=UPI002AC94EBB|nr:type IV pilus biogenesis/stability protein PilW [Actimicrobium sp. CCC2.4]MEB0134063.1 type IV pilus biogenesis/stability protein PilW [Actimicrobium sp. CCC2.4]WPX31596.1 type IV pilus biogenesis/stability protein PilW [Actimicrobium sp. CCC2.4]
MKNTVSLLLVSLLVTLAGCVVTGPGAPGSSGQAELATASDRTDNQRRAQIRLELAINYYQQGQLPVALDELKQALLSDPNLSDAYSVRALIYMNMGEIKLADDNFRTAIRLAPNNPELTSNYGWYLCQNGRAAESIAYFEATLKSRTYQEPSKALNNAGLCSLKLNDEAAAERYFKQAFQFDPNNASAMLSLANMHYNRREYERAQFYTGRLLKADVLSVEVLWLAIRTEHKLGNRTAENSLVTQLRRRYPASNEFAAYQRGAFDE